MEHRLGVLPGTCRTWSRACPARAEAKRFCSPAITIPLPRLPAPATTAPAWRHCSKPRAREFFPNNRTDMVLVSKTFVFTTPNATFGR